MDVVRGVLATAPRADGFVLRPPPVGDSAGSCTATASSTRRSTLGRDREALVARIVADYVERRDPRREAAWIAEVDGAPVGCVLCVRREDDVAQLRLLLVEPSARGRGIGARLIDGVPALRRAGRLSPDHAVDQRRPSRRAPALRARGLRARRAQRRSATSPIVGAPGQRADRRASVSSRSARSPSVSGSSGISRPSSRASRIASSHRSPRTGDAPRVATCPSV